MSYRPSVRSRRPGGATRAAALAQRRALRLAARSMVTPRWTTGVRYPGELKGVDTNISSAQVIATTGTNGDVYGLNLIASGTGSFQRVGRKVTGKSVRVMGYADCTLVTSAAGSDLYGNWLRMILVWDKQSSGANYPTFDTMFAKTVAAGTESSDIWSPPAYDTMSRFTVLKDWTMCVEPESTPTAGNTASYRLPFDVFVKLPGWETSYSDTTADITSINSGALYLILRANTNDATITTWGVYATARFRYSDI